MNARQLAARDAFAERSLVSCVIERRVVQAMPEPRRLAIVNRFDELIHQLEQPASPEALAAAAAILAVDPLPRQRRLPLP